MTTSILPIRRVAALARLRSFPRRRGSQGRSSVAKTQRAPAIASSCRHGARHWPCACSVVPPFCTRRRIRCLLECRRNPSTGANLARDARFRRLSRQFDTSWRSIRTNGLTTRRRWSNGLGGDPRNGQAELPPVKLDLSLLDQLGFDHSSGPPGLTAYAIPSALPGGKEPRAACFITSPRPQGEVSPPPRQREREVAAKTLSRFIAP
jgi:hypothetical protein